MKNKLEKTIIGITIITMLILTALYAVNSEKMNLLKFKKVIHGEEQEKLGETQVEAPEVAGEWDISETGKDITATLYWNGELKIKGTGKMKNYSYDDKVPWSSMKELVVDVEISEGVTSIGSYAFDGCSSLTNIIIPNNVINIGNYAFCRCSSLTNIIIPSSITSIGSHTFMDCSSLTNIEIPNSVISIGDLAFDNCNSLTNIEIPSNVIDIGSYSFAGCSSLTNIEVDTNNKSYIDEKGVLFNK